MPLLEASTLLGLVLPGELAVLTVGVLVHLHKLPLWVAIASGIAGAVIGDSIGYFVGKKYGAPGRCGCLRGLSVAKATR